MSQHIIRATLDEVEAGDFLRSLAPFATRFGLVRSTKIQTTGVALQLLARLAPFTLQREMLDSWPGTQRLDATTEERYVFRVDPKSLQLLMANIQSLRVKIPSLLFDLHLLREDNSVVMGTTTIDGVGWVDLNDVELRKWRSEYPDQARLIDIESRLPGQVAALDPLFGSSLGGNLDVAGLDSLAGTIASADREFAAAYLDSGTVLLEFPGITFDVLGDAFTMSSGADVLTDGQFLWRRDAAIYVRVYGVAPPEGPLELFRAARWKADPVPQSRLDEILEYVWRYL